MTFSRYRKNALRGRFSAKVSSTRVFRRKIKLKQEIPTTYSDYTCHLDAILRSLRFLDCEMSMQFCPVLCHLFRCFDPRFKEHIHCHLAFIIRDINSCRNGYSKGRLKSRESDHCNTQFALKFHHNLRHS